MVPVKKIVLITTGQPSVNPRIVKEADALLSAGHHVTMLYCHWIPWADEADKSILEEAKWKAVLVGGSPTRDRLKFYYSKLRFKFYRFLSAKNICKFQVAEKAQARCYTELLKKAISIKADYYIGHNLGALAVAANAAAFKKAKCGFDFEDYYRGEFDSKLSSDFKRTVYLEDKYVNHCNYLSFASPLILEKELLQLQNYEGKTLIINNCFPIQDNISLQRPDKMLKLFWFSQTVGPNRGVEQLFKALILLNDKNIALTIVGRIRLDKEAEYKNIATKIPGEVTFLGTVDPSEIHKICTEQDLGLALEPGFSLNNDIALSNKIFTYLSSGLAIIFSNTSAQSAFNDEYNTGLTFDKENIADLASCINLYLDSEKLYKQKKANWQLAKKILNWQEESKKLLAVLN